MYVNDPCYQDDTEYEYYYTCVLCGEQFEEENDHCVCQDCKDNEDWLQEWNDLHPDDRKCKEDFREVENGPDEDELYELKAGK